MLGQVAIGTVPPMHRLAKTLSALLVLLPLTAVAQQQNLPPNTVVGRLGISAGPAQAVPISQLLKNVVGPNSVTNAALAQMPAATFKCNPSASIANAQDCTIQGLSFSGTPNATDDRVLVYSASTGTLYATSPGSIASAATAGVSSIGSATGAIGLANGLKMTGSNLDLDLGNGLCISGTSVTGCLGNGLSYVSGNITWTPATAKYTNSGTGAVQQNMQDRLDSGFIYSSDFGTVCNSSTVDYTAMEAFLAAVAARGNVIGIINGNGPHQTNCFMGANPLRIRPGTHIMCARGVTISFANPNNRLVIPYNPSGARVFNGIFEGCTIDGLSTSTYPNTTGISLYGATDWIVRDVFVERVRDGIVIEDDSLSDNAAYYNRIENAVVASVSRYAYALLDGANSNTIANSRSVDTQYGLYAINNSGNSWMGGAIETFTSAGMSMDSGASNFTAAGLRIENNGTGTGVTLTSTATYFTNLGLYCAALGTNISGTGGGTYVKAGGNC